MIPKFREGSWDENIFKDIVWFNEYKLPGNLEEFLVVDIGGHIGSFTWLCDKLGSPMISSYEPLKENYKIFESWAGEKDNVVIINKAVWPEKEVKVTEFKDKINTGGFSILQEGDIILETIDLDTILQASSMVIEHPEEKKLNKILLKLDCEGAEFKILYSSKLLFMVDYICGEFHESKDNNIDQLKKYLEQKSFDVKIKRSKDNLGLFWASRKSKEKIFQIEESNSKGWIL